MYTALPSKKVCSDQWPRALRPRFDPHKCKILTTAQTFSKLSNPQIPLMHLERQNSKESSEKIQGKFGLIKQLEKHIVCHSVLRIDIGTENRDCY